MQINLLYVGIGVYLLLIIGMGLTILEFHFDILKITKKKRSFKKSNKSDSRL